MGVLAGVIVAACWLIVWPIAWFAAGVPLPIGAVAWVAGGVIAFLGVRWVSLAREPGDPVARVERRHQAQNRYEAERRRAVAREELARLEREEREEQAAADRTPH
jgi:hypothetical protein